MANRYIFDKEDASFRKERGSFGRAMLTVLKYFIASVSLAVVYYFIFSIFISTDTERKLKAENKMYAKLGQELAEKDKLLSDVVTGLSLRDDDIYMSVFKTASPDMNEIVGNTLLSLADSVSDRDLVEYAAALTGALEKSAARTEENFMEIFSLLKEGTPVPPMYLPVNDLSYAQSGASVGDRINPFYKVSVRHNGIDLIARAGEPVYATSPGTVTAVERSRKGLGNLVEITHEGGFVTRYGCLQDITVSKGRIVRKGALIGHVGMSGKSYSPHLHYEVLRDGIPLDPVNCFYGDLMPDDYAKFAVRAAMSNQSMD